MRLQFYPFLDVNPRLVHSWVPDCSFEIFCHWLYPHVCISMTGPSFVPVRAFTFPVLRINFASNHFLFSRRTALALLSLARCLLLSFLALCTWFSPWSLMKMQEIGNRKDILVLFVNMARPSSLLQAPTCSIANWKSRNGVGFLWDQHTLCLFSCKAIYRNISPVIVTLYTVSRRFHGGIGCFRTGGVVLFSRRVLFIWYILFCLSPIPFFLTPFQSFEQ